MTTETIVKVHPFFAKRKPAPKPPPPAVTAQPSPPPPPPINPLVLKSRIKPNELGQYPKSSIPAESSTSSAKRYARYREMMREQQRAQEKELLPPTLSPEEDLKLAFYGPDELWQERDSSKAKNSPARGDLVWPDKENGHVKQLEATEYPQIQPMYPSIEQIQQPSIDLDVEKIPSIRVRPDYEPSKHEYVTMTRSDVERMMDKVYPEAQWSSSHACRAKLDATFTNVDVSDRLWTDRHRPRRIQELLGNDHNHRYLQQWLQQLQIATPKQQQQQQLQKKKRTMAMELDDLTLDSSSDENFDDEDDEDFQPASKRRRATSKRNPKSNIILLVGPTGIGKTAAVYTAAEQVGYDVFELHAGVKRSGKDLMATVGEMTESHHVSFSEAANRGRKRPKTTGAAQKKKAEAKGSIMHFMRPKRDEDPMDVDLEEQEEENDVEEDEEDNKIPEPAPSAKQSLILLEDVDLLYDDDKGFWTSVSDLAQKSKRPIIMTTNDPDFIPIEGLKLQAVLRFNPPRTNTLLPYLQLLALSEGYLVNPGDLVSLVGTLGSDIRRLIQTLQVWCKHTSPEPYTGGSRRTFCVCSHLFVDYMGMNNIVSLPTVERRLEITQRYSERRDQVEVDQLCWRYVRDKPTTGSVKEAFASNDLRAICNAMDTASFMDAWIRPHGPEQVHVVDKDLICGYAGTYNVASAASHQAAEPVAVLNGERLENRKWQRRFHEWSGTWGDLCDMRTAFFDECTEAVERLLSYRLANQPIKDIVMTEYVPRIREMCEQKIRRSRRKRYWTLADEQVQLLVRERRIHDETRLWCAQADENTSRWNSIGLKIL